MKSRDCQLDTTYGIGNTHNQTLQRFQKLSMHYHNMEKHIFRVHQHHKLRTTDYHDNIFSKIWFWKRRNWNCYYWETHQLWTVHLLLVWLLMYYEMHLWAIINIWMLSQLKSTKYGKFKKFDLNLYNKGSKWPNLKPTLKLQKHYHCKYHMNVSPELQRNPNSHKTLPTSIFWWSGCVSREQS